jgi:hypothetical protein
MLAAWGRLVSGWEIVARDARWGLDGSEVVPPEVLDDSQRVARVDISSARVVGRRTRLPGTSFAESEPDVVFKPSARDAFERGGR